MLWGKGLRSFKLRNVKGLEGFSGAHSALTNLEPEERLRGNWVISNGSKASTRLCWESL